MYDWLAKMTTHPKRLEQFRRLMGKVPRLFCLPLLYAAAFFLRLKFATSAQQVMENMAEILPERSKQEIHKLTRHYFHHLFLTIYEILVDSLRLRESAVNRFRVQGEEYLEAALQKRKGAILYSPHTGNFFYYYWYLTQKYNCMTVATAGSPELRPLYLIFQQMGCKGLDYDDTPPLVLYRTLREHLKQNGVVFLLGDFYRPNFPEATLFQRKTRLPNGAASLALELGSPVIPFYGYRGKGMGHELVFLPPIDLAEQFQRNQRDEAMRLLHQVMENLILAKPEQWFYWFHANERWEEISIDKSRKISS